MEDKITVTVPVAYYSSGLPDAIDKTAGSAFGASVCGNPALIFNLIQFMKGAPVVDYNSIVITPTGSDPTGCLSFIDTSRPYADRQSHTAVVSTDVYSNYTDTVLTGVNGSQASGAYTITIEAGAATFSIEDSGANPLYQSDLSTATFPFNAPIDVYESGGDFLFCLEISNTPQGGALGSWTAGDTIDFTVLSPTYRPLMNWGEITDTTRSDTNEANNATALIWDTHRGEGNRLDVLSTLDEFAFIGLQFVSSNAQCNVNPLDNVAGNMATAQGDFYSAPGNTDSATGSMTGGRAFNADPALAFRQPNVWTIFRGPGYVRILAQVEDYQNPGEIIRPDVENVYFLGMMSPYETQAEYRYPIAILTDTYADANTVPWWRQADMDSQAWVDLTGTLGHWQYTGPFITNKNFTMDGTLDENNDLHLPIPSVAGGLNIPDFDAGAGGTTAFTTGSKDDSVRVYGTRFDGSLREFWYDADTDYECVEKGIAARMSGSHKADRIVEPVILYQVGSDGHTWSAETNYESATILPVNTNFEAIGYLPGIFWGNDKAVYQGSVIVNVPAGSEDLVRVGNDVVNLRTVIGYNSSIGDNGAVSVNGENDYHSGNILFNMDEA